MNETDRFLSKTVVTESCWEWLGGKSPKGYGIFHIKRVGRRAHRVAYEHFIGSIPEGLVLDHLCENKGCVNPFHLEPTTIGENVNRGTNSNAKRTHCVHGHALVPGNIYRWQKKPNKRSCRECRRSRQLKCKEVLSVR